MLMELGKKYGVTYSKGLLALIIRTSFCFLTHVSCNVNTYVCMFYVNTLPEKGQKLMPKYVENNLKKHEKNIKNDNNSLISLFINLYK